MIQYGSSLFLVIMSSWIASGSMPQQHGLFPTKKIKHVEPLRSLKIHHEDVSNPQPLRIKSGLHQPYPDQMELHFEAFGKKISYPNLRIMDKLFAPHSEYQIHRDNGVVVRRPHVLNAYSQEDLVSSNGAVVVMLNDGNFTATFLHDGELHYAEPLYYHTPHIENRVFSTLSHHAVHNMVVFKDSDIIIDSDNPPMCGVQKDSQSPILRSPNTHSRLLREFSETPLQGWDCAGDGVVRVVKIGFVGDYGFVRSFSGDVQNARDAIVSYVANSNRVYMEQVMVALQASDIILKETATQGTYESWNTDNNNCPSISSKLTLFAEWRTRVQPTKNGLWHLMTNCYPSGTVGLASLGVLCLQELTQGGSVSSSSTGVSSKTGGTWKTVAHEIGHNFDMRHSFSGNTHYGGIMDYGDGTLNGIYQFNTQHRKTETCTEINLALADKEKNNRYSNTEYVKIGECIGSYNPVCGNGVIEPPEVCDGGICCIKPGESGECTPISTAECYNPNAECCDNNCKFKITASTCDGGAGYCNNGECTRTICDQFSWTSCGTTVCQQSCTVNGNCNDLKWYTFTFSGQQISGTEAARVNDGAVCSESGGTCKAGVCEESQNLIASWRTSAWTSCPVTCGNGIQTRSVECYYSNNQKTSDDKCSGSKPLSEQPCSPTPPNCPTYSWKYTSYSACSHDCKQSGGQAPTQSRTAYCEEDNTVQIVSNSYCSETTAGSLVRECNTVPCQLKWVVDENWSQCSKECGSGTQIRSVECHELLGMQGLYKVVDDSSCLDSKPSSTQSCNTNACETYSYVRGTWSPCTQTCGGGTQNRIVECIESSTQRTVLNSFCADQKIPKSERTCNTASCPIYQWSMTAWSTNCPNCGTGSNDKQTRTVKCINFADNKQIEMEDYYCTNQKPKTEQACPVTDVCPVYEWQFDSWSDCKVGQNIASCGIQGQMTRAVDCYNVAPITPQKQSITTLCTAAKPDTSETCTGACTVDDNKWIAEPWDLSKCSKKCGLGILSRTVDCYGPNGAKLGPENCLGVKPATESGCNAFSCPTWFAGEWGECSESCDDGIQSRILTCRNYKGEMVDQLECKASMPSVTQPCFIQACPHWHREPWTVCNKPCSGGMQYRLLTCRMPHDTSYFGRSTTSSLCPPNDQKPISEQQCNVEICGAYYWDGLWSDCSQTCGNGTQEAAIKCYDSMNGKIVDDSKCLSVKPLGIRPCNEQTCPEAIWVADDWTDCSAECGGGVRTRNVQCLNQVSYKTKYIYDVIDIAYCQGLPRPPSEETCNNSPTCGSFGDCVNKKCKCPRGYSSTATNQCDVRGSISDVVVSGRLHLTPPGEPLTVRWQTSGAIDFVSLMIVGQDGFLSYIETNVPNTFLYIYTTPSDLPAGTYNIRIFVSKHPDYTISAESNTFTVDEPCDHVNCLNGGSCQLGKSGDCTCAGKYGGTSCDKLLFWGFGDCDSNGCTCSNDYIGEFCRTPQTCSNQILKCQHGSVPKASDPCPTICTAPNSDICPIGFEGDLCEICVTECLNGGSINPSDCNNCNCLSGYYSSTCACGYGEITVSLKEVNPAIETESGKEILMNDFARALHLDTQWIGIETSQQKEIKVKLFDNYCTLITGVMKNIATLQTQVSDPLSNLLSGHFTSNLDTGIFSYVPPPSWVDKCQTRTCSGFGDCDLETGECKCYSGFIGANCETVDLCYEKTCNDKGTCTAGVCDCKTSGWQGENCNIPPDGCASRTCSDHGTCQNSMCLCKDGWSGQDCEILPDACYNKTCSSNGVCFGGECICFDGFEGVDCGTQVNFCPVGHCNSHGTCTTSGKCICVDGFTGPTCKIPPPSCSDGIKNQNEEKTDCGGPCVACPTCKNGQQDPNEGGVDCGGPCLPCATCGDGIQNGEEKGIDCGGSVCAPCDKAASCTDGSKNGLETGIDCGGGTCPPCITYAWSVSSNWSSCTVDCGEGIQTRERQCKDTSTGSTVDDIFCSQLHPVSSSQPCGEQPCWNYTWRTGNFGDCSVPCGGGIKIRALTCTQDLGETVSNAYCDLKAGVKPIVTEACNPSACPKGSYFWSIDPNWGDCVTQTQCSGTQSREVLCMNSEQQSVDLSNCNSDDKPITTQECSTQDCVSYEWITCDWDACTAECGGGEAGGTAGGSMLGEKTRLVLCQRSSDGKNVDGAFCDPEKRKGISDSEVGCNPQSCEDYNWMTSKWSACMNPDPYGKGYRKRTYHCHAADGANALVQDCDDNVGYKTPIDTETCYINQCPSTGNKFLSRSMILSPFVAGSTMILWVATLNWLAA